MRDRRLEDATQEPGSVNHLGVEVETTDEVASAADRLTRAGLSPRREEQAACCYALQDKVWVDAPDGEAWELYAVVTDLETPTFPGGDQGPRAAPDCSTNPALDDRSGARQR
jgi:hypothetical protein